MRPLTLLLLIVCLKLWCFAPAVQARQAAGSPTPPIRAAGLRTESQSILIDYVSSGCFHGTHYQFRYEPIPTPRISVWVEVQDWKKDEQGKEYLAGKEMYYLAAVTLTAKQVALFDNLLNCYRLVDRVSSTTVDSVTIQLAENGETIVRSGIRMGTIGWIGGRMQTSAI